MNLIKMKTLLFIALCLIGWTLTALADDIDDIVVIVNEKGPLINIAERDIKDIYLGEKRIVSDVRITPFEPKDNDIKERFLSSFIKMADKEYRIYWTKKVFQDGIQPPASLTSMEDIVEMVKREKGAIGYVNKKRIKDEKGVRIIKVIQ
ncbi:MAG: hypothetical protein HY265_03525 [Deltaproteobacteria bacterium]|nr:hypothetical protein [Deltaproteobacteria bacterium]MBI3755215.1 hypothetical protein [Deltaproteobacteria bacterium]